MIKRILPVALLGTALFGMAACKHGGGDSDGFKRIHGIEYKIIKDAPGKNAKTGDMIEFHFYAAIDTAPNSAMVLADSRKSQNGKPATDRVPDLKGNQPQWQAVLPYLSAGDSAVVQITTDSILKSLPPQQAQQVPPWMKKGRKIVITLSIVSVTPSEEVAAKQAEEQKKMAEEAAKQAPLDDKTIQDYLAKNNIKAEKTSSGLYYKINKPGTGNTAKAGQMVTMNYIGKTLDGKQFDANVDANGKLLDGKQPFTFPLGAGRVIKGWDEAVQLLKKGSKATFYIPSGLAYGPQAMGNDIPANSILIFDVELTDIKEGGGNGPQMQGRPQ